MKKLIILLTAFLLLSGCSHTAEPSQIAATTLPVYDFTTRLCQGTGLTVARLITENVSCLHDYTLKVNQMRAIEGAKLIVINGAGLEDFMSDALDKAAAVADASEGLSLLHADAHHHDDHGHTHEDDPHIWLSPENAAIMAQNICNALCRQFPAHEITFQNNLISLLKELDTLQKYGDQALCDLKHRDLITFHDGFTYLAESFDLTILHAVEEESGAETSAAELIELINEVREHAVPAIFIESNGSDSAAKIIAAETGVNISVLDMAMSGEGYFDAMYRNIDTLKEALQ